MSEIQANEDFRKELGDLETANAMLTDFAAVISHDVRSRLRRVFSYAELLAVLPTLNDNARARDCLHHIINAARRMAFFADEALEPGGRFASEAARRSAGTSVSNENSVETRLREMRGANRNLSALAETIAGGLGAPLSQILRAAGDLTASRAVIMNPVSLEMAGNILAAAEQMQRLIDDYLSFVNAERHKIQRSRVSLDSLVQLVRHELEPLCAGRRVEWQIGPLPEVEADPSMLRQVLLNLLGNSLKYTRKRRKAVIEMGARAEPGEHVICIRDNGIGFDLDSARKLFQKFGRLCSNEDYPGAGVGLLIVKYIIERHHGRVWAEGVPEGGATFCFTLPAVS